MMLTRGESVANGLTFFLREESSHAGRSGIKATVANMMTIAYGVSLFMRGIPFVLWNADWSLSFRLVGRLSSFLGWMTWIEIFGVLRVVRPTHAAKRIWAREHEVTTW
jgi:hypothetical protein